jgi:hypothetical protein
MGTDNIMGRLNKLGQRLWLCLLLRLLLAVVLYVLRGVLLHARVPVAVSSVECDLACSLLLC